MNQLVQFFFATRLTPVTAIKKKKKVRVSECVSRMTVIHIYMMAQIRPWLWHGLLKFPDVKMAKRAGK